MGQFGFGGSSKKTEQKKQETDAKNDKNIQEKKTDMATDKSENISTEKKAGSDDAGKKQLAILTQMRNLSEQLPYF